MTYYIGVDPGNGQDETEICVISVEVVERIKLTREASLQDVANDILEAAKRFEAENVLAENNTPMGKDLQRLLFRCNMPIDSARVERSYSGKRSYIVEQRPISAYTFALLAAMEGETPNPQSVFPSIADTPRRL